MRIQRNVLNNIIRSKRVKSNSKKNTNVSDSSSFKHSYNFKKEDCFSKFDEDNINSVLDKGFQINESNRDNTSIINEETSINNKNHYTLFQNIFLINSLNLNRNHNMKNNINISGKSYNFREDNKYEKNLTNSINKKSRNDKIKNSINNNVLNHSKKNVKVPLKRVRDIMKYLAQSSNFQDLNLRPSSEKSWYFKSEKKRPKTSSKIERYIMKSAEHKKIIHKIHSNEKINKFKYISIDNDNFKKKIKNKNNNLHFFINISNKSSNIKICKSHKDKKDKIILIRNNINRRKEPNSIKPYYLNNINIVHKNYITKNQTIKKYRLNSCKNSNCYRRKILINNHKENNMTLNHNNDNKKCDLKVNIISKNFPSYDNSGNRDNNLDFINSIFH